MIREFDNFCKSILEDMAVASVLGSDGPYPTNDVRVPKILGTYSRKGKVKMKKFKKRKK